MNMYYINSGGVRGMAMGGILLDLADVARVGAYWPASKDDSAHFDVAMKDGTKEVVYFDPSVSVPRQLEEHARLVNAMLEHRSARQIEFETPQKTAWDASDPDGAWLMTGRALGAFAAYLYQRDRSATDKGESEEDIAIRLVETFALQVFGDSMGMDEFAKARDTAKWQESRDDPDRIWSPGFGEEV